MAPLTAAASCACSPYVQQATTTFTTLQQPYQHTIRLRTSGSKSKLHRPRLRLRCKSSSSTSGENSQFKLTRQTLQESMQKAMQEDTAYLLKILAASVAGAATVKFGSLMIDTPFSPSLLTAIGIITLPCIAYSIVLYNRPE